MSSGSDQCLSVFIYGCVFPDARPRTPNSELEDSSLSDRAYPTVLPIWARWGAAVGLNSRGWIEPTIQRVLPCQRRAAELHSEPCEEWGRRKEEGPPRYPISASRRFPQECAETGLGEEAATSHKTGLSGVPRLETMLGSKGYCTGTVNHHRRVRHSEARISLIEVHVAARGTVS